MVEEDTVVVVAVVDVVEDDYDVTVGIDFAAPAHNDISM